MKDTTNYEELRAGWLKSPEAKFYSPRGNKVITVYWIDKIKALLSTKTKTEQPKCSLGFSCKSRSLKHFKKFIHLPSHLNKLDK